MGYRCTIGRGWEIQLGLLLPLLLELTSHSGAPRACEIPSLLASLFAQGQKKLGDSMNRRRTVQVLRQWLRLVESLVQFLALS